MTAHGMNTAASTTFLKKSPDGRFCVPQWTLRAPIATRSSDAQEFDVEVEFSIVIPVFNAGAALNRLIDEVHAAFGDHRFEVVLVNDGSRDNSEQVCLAIVERFPHQTTFVQLTRNFGEHHAVLAGLAHARGNYVGIIDDDGQNPPEELHRMWSHIQQTGDDVLYGRYRDKRHSRFRNLGSCLHNGLATVLLGKPADLYLSSFKVLSQRLVHELVRQTGPFAYLDGSIVRSTDRIGQMEVAHRDRQSGRSGYNLSKLLRLSMAMCFGYSLWPLRATSALGGVTCLIVLGLLIATAVQNLWLQPRAGWGLEMLGLAVLCFSGIQLVSLGIVGEYVGRLWLRESGAPAYVVRYTRAGRAGDD